MKGVCEELTIAPDLSLEDIINTSISKDGLLACLRRDANVVNVLTHGVECASASPLAKVDKKNVELSGKKAPSPIPALEGPLGYALELAP